MFEKLIDRGNRSKCWACGAGVRTGHILCGDDWNRMGSPARKRMRRIIKALQPTESKTAIDRVGLDLDLIRQQEARYQKRREEDEVSRTTEAIAWILRDFPNHERSMRVYAPGNPLGHPTTLTVMHFISGLYSVFQTSDVALPPDREFVLRRPTDSEFARWTVERDHAGHTVTLTRILNVDQIVMLRGE